MFCLHGKEIGKLSEGSIQCQPNGTQINLKTSSNQDSDIQASSAKTESSNSHNNSEQPVQILKNNELNNNENENEKILYPIKPYHERLQNYMKIRNEIFNNNSPSLKLNKIKRSTLRLRNFWKEIRKTKKLLVSSIFNNKSDLRFYAEVQFLGRKEIGLLDTGASISCIGED